jgi:RNA polymerase sigma-70 factor (ECF subfamily)
MNPDEEKTWRSIQQKDGQAFENYYKEHYKLFFLAACNYFKDTGLAEEIVNDVFVKLWEIADTIQIETSLKSYIYRAVVNRSLNDTYELKGMEDNELKISLYKAIDQLPEQCQKVFRMSRFEELKQQEIADQLGISIKTVKNHITHALKQLNKVLGDWKSLPLWIWMIKEFFWPYN